MEIERKRTTHEVVERKSIESIYSFSPKETKIDDLILWLSNAQKEGATHVDFGGYCFDEQIQTIYAQPCYYDLEPEEEYNKRVQEAKWAEREKKINELQKQRELYETLKQKFENGDPFANI